MTAVLVAAAAVLAAAGLSALLLAVWPGQAALLDGLTMPGRHSVGRFRTAGLRAAGGVAVGGAVWASTGWPAAGWWLGLLAGWLPSLAGRGRARRADAARVEAVARWAEMVRDQVRVGADVGQAITAAAAVAPDPIAGPAERLAERLAVGDTAGGLAAFADDLDDPMGDVLAVALRLALTRPTGRLSELLAELARATREQASLRLRVEADRGRLRTVTWGVLAAVAGWLTAIYLLSGRYLAAYNGPAGQAVLLLAGGAFAAGLAGLARLDRIPAGPRLTLSVRGRP